MALIFVGLAGWAVTIQAGFNDGQDAPVASYGISRNNPNVRAHVEFLTRQIEERRKETGNRRQVRIDNKTKTSKLNYIAHKTFIVRVVFGNDNVLYVSIIISG